MLTLLTVVLDFAGHHEMPLSLNRMASMRKCSGRLAKQCLIPLFNDMWLSNSWASFQDVLNWISIYLSWKENLALTAIFFMLLHGLSLYQVWIQNLNNLNDVSLNVPFFLVPAIVFLHFLWSKAALLLHVTLFINKLLDVSFRILSYFPSHPFSHIWTNCWFITYQLQPRRTPVMFYAWPTSISVFYCVNVLFPIR